MGAVADMPLSASRTRGVAVVGGGIAGLAAAYELAKMQREGTALRFTLFEASSRLGGIVETHREDGFVVECGPDGWVTEKPWAQALVEELGLADEIIPSKDAERKTWVLRDNRLHAIPDGMRMMIPTDMDALRGSDLFSESAIAAYAAEPARAEELRTYAAAHADEDESVSAFVRRHFGDEVTQTIAAPLLAGVFGGDVEALSVRAVMAPFVALESEHGSLITALQMRTKKQGAQSIFTTLRSGTGTLVDRMAASLPAGSIRIETQVERIARDGDGWLLTTNTSGVAEHFDVVMLAVPAHVARVLLQTVDAESASLLAMDASSAIIVGLGFDAEQAASLRLPQGFGFLVPPHTKGVDLLAGTFSDQKYSDRVPAGGRSMRLFFGGAAGARLQGDDDDALVDRAREQAETILGMTLPPARITLVRRWPRSLPQYLVGHGERMQRLQDRVDAMPGLMLLGNAYRGVGLPDLIRDGRAAARSLVS